MDDIKLFQWDERTSKYYIIWPHATTSVWLKSTLYCRFPNGLQIRPLFRRGQVCDMMLSQFLNLFSNVHNDLFVSSFLVWVRLQGSERNFEPPTLGVPTSLSPRICKFVKLYFMWFWAKLRTPIWHLARLKGYRRLNSEYGQLSKSDVFNLYQKPQKTASWD